MYTPHSSPFAVSCKAANPTTKSTSLCPMARPAQRRLLAKGWDMAPNAKAANPLPAHDPCTIPTEHTQELNAHLSPFNKNTLGRGTKQHPHGPPEICFPHPKSYLLASTGHFLKDNLTFQMYNLFFLSPFLP